MSKTHAPLWWLPWGDDGVDRGGSSGCDDDDDDVKMVVGAGCGGDRGGGGSAWRRLVVRIGVVVTWGGDVLRGDGVRLWLLCRDGGCGGLGDEGVDW
ncbi:hypothetical protein Tco_0737527 [Tanacetum coccineum]